MNETTLGDLRARLDAALRLCESRHGWQAMLALYARFERWLHTRSRWSDA